MDSQEFITAVNQCRGMIFRLVSVYVDAPDDRNDLFQDIVLNAWKSIDNFRGEAKFSTWLYRIALNTIFTTNRKKRLVTYGDENAASYIAIPPQTEQREEAQRLRLAISRLAETDRAIVTMHLEGYDNPEIAATIGISANYVAVKLIRIKQQLQTLLKPL